MKSSGINIIKDSKTAMEVKEIPFLDLYSQAFGYYKESCNITDKMPQKRKLKIEKDADKIWETIKEESVKVVTEEHLKSSLLGIYFLMR